MKLSALAESVPESHSIDSSAQNPPTSPLGRHLLLVAFVALLALLLASHPARNSVLWAHLAIGRDLARFSAPAEVFAGLPVLRPWLFNLGVYLAHQTVGEAGLVGLKAFLFVVLALLLFDLCRQPGNGPLAACCTVLTLLACSTRVLLQPVTVSYLLFALALWLLYRPRRPSSLAWLPPWPLLLLLVVWANVDAWVVVGVLSLALLWIGRALDGSAEPSERRPFAVRLLHGLIGAVLLALPCLLTPHPLQAFAPPEELRGLLRPMEAMAFGRTLSPFQADYFQTIGASPAGWAFFPLLAGGLLSFVLNGRRWQWQRVLPWLWLAALSSLEARTIPFFAILAGPILAWNLAEAVGSPQRVRSGWRPIRLYWATLGACLAVGLLICAWPGWLQGPKYEPRRWAIELPAAPAQGAKAVQAWLARQHLPPGSRVLHLSPETAFAFAWICPEIPGVRDPLLASALLGNSSAPPDWPTRLRSAGVRYLVLGDHSSQSSQAVPFWADSQQWPLLFVGHGLAVFGWRDPATADQADPFAGQLLQLGRLAFGPDQPPSHSERNAPTQLSRPWYEAFWKPAPAPSSDREEAQFYAQLTELVQRQTAGRQVPAWQSVQSAALIGTAASWSLPSSLADCGMRLLLIDPTLAPPDRFAATAGLVGPLAEQAWRRASDAPFAVLLLTIRAARRAIAANPDDAQSHFLLGQAYLQLLQNTRERVWANRLPELGQLRLAQAVAALNRAVVLRPSLTQAHRSLAEVYRELGYLDLSVSHLRTYLNLRKEAGPPTGLDSRVFQKEIERLQQSVQRLTGIVEERLKDYQTQASNERVFIRASLARERGLAGLARDTLLESDIAAFGIDGLLLELELLLGTGRAWEVQEWTEERHKGALGRTYHWFRAQAFAALGDYNRALQECQALATTLQPGGVRTDAEASEVIAGLVCAALLESVPTGTGLFAFLRQATVRAENLSRLANLTRSLSRQADVWVLRGLLALELGELAEAEDAFRQALDLWQEGKGVDFNGRPIAETYLDFLEAARR